MPGRRAPSSPGDGEVELVRGRTKPIGTLIALNEDFDQLGVEYTQQKDPWKSDRFNQRPVEQRFEYPVQVVQVRWRLQLCPNHPHQRFLWVDPKRAY